MSNQFWGITGKWKSLFKMSYNKKVTGSSINYLRPIHSLPLSTSKVKTISDLTRKLVFQNFNTWKLLFQTGAISSTQGNLGVITSSYSRSSLSTNELLSKSMITQLITLQVDILHTFIWGSWYCISRSIRVRFISFVMFCLFEGLLRTSLLVPWCAYQCHSNKQLRRSIEA